MLVYRHIRLDKNEPFYIGIGNEKRPYEKRNRNKIWNNIVSKTDYEVEILFYDLNVEKACEKEIEFIKLYGRIDLKTGILANLTDGGDYYGCSGYKHTKEHKEYISDRLKGKPKTEQCKERLRKINTGKKLSQESRDKISKVHKGKLKTEEFKKSVSENNKTRNKIIIDGILYNSIKDAAFKLNIPYINLWRKIKNNKI
jgi:hypothetical protein